MKIQTIALLLAATISATNGVAIQDDSFKDTVVQVFDVILNVTQAALDDANTILNTLETDQAEITEDIIAFVVQLGKDFNVIFLDGIDQLRNETSADANHVIDCIDAERNQTEEAFAEVSRVVGQCAATEIDVVLAQIKKILDQLVLLQDEVREEVDSLSSCTLSDAICLISFITKATETIGKVIDTVEADIEEIVELVRTIVEDFEACPIVDTIFARTQEIFNEGVICIVGH